MKKARVRQEAAVAAPLQDQQQALLDQALKLPGVEEAFAVYNQAIKSLPSVQGSYGLCYSTDVNSVSAS